MQGIGEEIVSPNVLVQGDFEVRCMWYGTVPVPVGEAICLHTAFLADDLFVRVDLTADLHLDLIFCPSKGEDADEDSFWQAIGKKLGPEEVQVNVEYEEVP